MLHKHLIHKLFFWKIILIHSAILITERNIFNTINIVLDSFILMITLLWFSDGDQLLVTDPSLISLSQHHQLHPWHYTPPPQLHQPETWTELCHCWIIHRNYSGIQSGTNNSGALIKRSGGTRENVHRNWGVDTCLRSGWLLSKAVSDIDWYV